MGMADLAAFLALVLLSAKLAGEVALRLRQPPVLGELVAGIVLGNLPSAPLAAFMADATVERLADLGVLMLMFEVGLEATVRDVLAVGRAAARVALIGSSASLVAGYVVARLLLPAAGTLSQLFLGAALCATSVGVTARVFKDLGKSKAPEARAILGAAVIDDVISLVALAFASGWLREHAAGTSSLSFGSLAWLLLKTVGFLAAAVVLGVRFTPRLFANAARLRTPGTLLALGLVFCFTLAWAANAMGLAPLVGAFAAGLVLEELHSARFTARGERSLSELIEPISAFLVPIFFVVMGMRADLHALLRVDTLVLVAGLTCAALVGKLLSSFGATPNLNRLAIGFGMLPRGEVSLIFGSLGLTLTLGGHPILDHRVYSALVAVVMLTTLLTPLLLRGSLERPRASTPPPLPDDAASRSRD
jgi:Kef-type K+ transport system membrane component KefB